MCRIITAVVPADFDLSARKLLLEQYGMSFEEIKNSFVEAQINGDRYVRATRAFCDCDALLGIEPKVAVKPSDIEKRRKKGWSSNKIERWLAEKSIASKDRAEKRAGELKHWNAFIDKLLRGGAKRLGLLVHIYSGRIDEEKVELQRVERVLLSDLDKVLLRMELDVLYMISDSCAD